MSLLFCLQNHKLILPIFVLLCGYYTISKHSYFFEIDILPRKHTWCNTFLVTKKIPTNSCLFLGTKKNENNMPHHQVPSVTICTRQNPLIFCVQMRWYMAVVPEIFRELGCCPTCRLCPSGHSLNSDLCAL